MRTVEVIDSELRALTAFRAACAADGAPVRSTAAVDGLLDERAAIARESMTHRRSSTTTPLLEGGTTPLFRVKLCVSAGQTRRQKGGNDRSPMGAPGLGTHPGGQHHRGSPEPEAPPREAAQTPRPSPETVTEKPGRGRRARVPRKTP
ncbi:hypothetical protein PBI_BUTTERS_34 [Mycobacterium phage Butters]|uniref:Uncharacterized protein n=1 Tax=Mycobacterium phage Butters TaxID=1296646 RepID=M4W692_9CAUD|nr:hypothetical protein K768_gp34 [Mycobacterium phage Butters]AGI12981.1 hypothetical protein PBI_BUTTERS_34 [Mycobacterium phage Butters]